jgi:glycosyltransferase involved in cell wall biosynthesis
MPRFTVAIPTHNRAHYLPYTLSCLLRQAYRDFEIVISDNASSDGTGDVVRQFQDKRIRYVRQSELLCAGANWAVCADMAQADWIVFNQDDDVLSPYFLERCARAIDTYPDIVMYATNCMISTDVTRHHGGSLAGFPFGHHWDQAQPRLFPGSQIAALGWFINCFFPPAQAMRTSLFRKHWPRGPEAVFLADHYLTSHIACEGAVAYESYIGAIIREHANRITNTTPDIARRRLETPFIMLRTLLEERKVDWQNALRSILPEFPLAYREWLLNEYLFNEFIASEALEILAASIAVEKQVSSMGYIEALRAEKLRPAPIGRLDRWKFPKPMARVIRGLLYAAGKDYS